MIMLWSCFKQIFKKNCAFVFFIPDAKMMTCCKFDMCVYVSCGIIALERMNQFYFFFLLFR